MRRQYLVWSIAVFGVVGTVYGASSLIYNLYRGKGLYIPALVLLICGGFALVLFIVLYTITYFQMKKREKERAPLEAEVVEEKEEEPVKEEIKPEPVKNPEPEEKEMSKEEFVRRIQKPSPSSSSYSVSTVYVKQVGYGPLLRVEGNRIIDMRSNTYYRIEGDMVMQEGSGPVFEIRGNQIKNAFGGYLYELSGSNINKVFGGFYASISGNYITLYDASIKYEMTDGLSKKQLLAVTALLFGNN